MTTQIKRQKLSDSTNPLLGLGGVGKRYFFQKDDEKCEQKAIRQNSPMTITDYLIQTDEGWAFILSDEAEKQLTLFD